MKQSAAAQKSDKPLHVYSTLTADNTYNEWLKTANDLPALGRSVTIKGGSNVANKNIVTPIGVRTQITADDLEVLEGCKVFQMHRDNGFVRVEQHRADPEKIAADMALRDGSAPMRPGEGKALPRGDGGEDNRL